VLDVDTTIKPLYGEQEGAELGYNPHKPGRPSHCYHPKSGSWMIARWRRIGRNHRDGDGEDEFGGSPRG